MREVLADALTSIDHLGGMGGDSSGAGRYLKFSKICAMIAYPVWKTSLDFPMISIASRQIGILISTYELVWRNG